MLPTFELFGQTIYSYAFFWYIRFTLLFIFSFFYNRSGVAGRLPTLDFISIYALFIVAAIYGSKLMGYLINVMGTGEGIGVIFSMSMRVFEETYGRNMLYGGMAAVLLVCFAYSRIFKIPLKKIFGIFVPFAGLLIFFLRLGCFSAGCYYGVPLFVFSYALFRFVIEFFRGDVQRDILFLSLSQWVSLAAAVVIAVWYLKYRSKTIDHHNVGATLCGRPISFNVLARN